MTSITDKTLVAWRDWIVFKIANTTDSFLAGLQIRINDTEERCSYPSILVRAGSVELMEAGGISDCNVFTIDIETALESIPGLDDDIATSRDTHEKMRAELADIVNDCYTQEWIDSRLGISCFRVLQSSPTTTAEDKFRVTTWENSAICCNN